jgi:hypothetical protein
MGWADHEVYPYGKSRCQRIEHDAHNASIVRKARRGEQRPGAHAAGIHRPAHQQSSCWLARVHKQDVSRRADEQLI